MKPGAAFLCMILSGLTGFGAATVLVAPAPAEKAGDTRVAPSPSKPAPAEAKEEDRLTTEPVPSDSPHAEILNHAHPGSAEPLALFHKRLQQNGGGTYQTERLLRQMYKESLASSLAFLEGITDPEMRKRYASLMLYNPPPHDVPALLQWMKQQGDPDFRTDVLSLLMKHWTRQDQEAVLGAIEALPEDNRSALYAKMLKDLPASQQLASLSKIPDADRESFFATHAKKLSKRLPEESFAMMMELRPSEDRATAMTGLLRNWATKDPLRAIQSLERENDPDLATQGFRDVAFGWSSVDSYRASNWINELKPGPTRDAASSGLAEEMAGEQPDRAFEWAASIRDSELRIDTLRKVMDQWGATDSTAAAAALKNAPLTNEERSALAPRPKTETP